MNNWIMRFFFIGLLLLALASLPGIANAVGTPSIVQSYSTNSAGSFESSFAFTIPNTIVAGSSNTIVVAVEQEGGTTWTNTVTDNQGDTFVKVANVLRGSNFDLSIWVANNLNGGSTTITVGNNGGGFPLWMVLAREYTGISATNVIDANSVFNLGSSITPNTLTLTTSSANDVLVASCILNHAALTLTVGTQQGNFITNNDPNAQIALESNGINTAATYNAAMGSGASAGWTCGAVALRSPSFNLITLPTLSLSNTVIDNGQNILFTANTFGGSGTYTFNYSIINTNGIATNAPLAFYMSCPQFNGGTGPGTSGCNVNALFGNALNPNSVVFRDNGYAGIGNIQLNVTANVPRLTMNGGTIASYNIQANELVGNGINACLWIGGAPPNQATPTNYSASWNSVLRNATSAYDMAQNTLALMANIPNISCIEIDPEAPNQGSLAFGWNKIFSQEYTSNILAIYPNTKFIWTVFITDIQSPNGFATSNIINTANYMIYDSSPEAGPGVTKTLAQLQGNYPITQTLYWFDGSQPAAYTNMAANSAAAVTNGFGGLAYYSGYFSQGNFLVYNAFYAANALYTKSTSSNMVVANYLTTNTQVSNSFLWITSKPLYPNNNFVANVVISNQGTTLASVYEPFGYNSAPKLSITVSNSALSTGQYTTFTISETGGTGPNFNVELYNITGGTQQGSNVIVPIGGSNVITIQGLNTGTFSFNAIGYDEGTMNAFTSNSNTQPITVTGSQSAVMTFSNTLIDSGQYQVLTVIATGGSPPRTFSFFNTTSGAAVPIAGCQNLTGVGSNLCTIRVNTPVSGNTFSYNALVTASDTTPNTINTTSNSFVVNVTLATPTIIVSQYPIVGVSQNEVFTAYASGGSGSPYTYNFQVFNSVTSVLITNQLSTSNTFTWTVSSSLGTTFSANVFVKDGATTPVTKNSVKIATVTVANVALGLTPASGYVTLGSMDQWIAQVSTGATLPLTYNWLVLNNANELIYNVMNTNVNFYTNTFIYTPNQLGNFIVSVTTNDPTSLSGGYNAIVPLYLENQSAVALNITPTNTSLLGINTVCTNNFAGGACNGNFVYNTATALTKDLFVNGNVTIIGPTVLTTDGHIIVINGKFNGNSINGGTIYTGTAASGTWNAPTSFTISYGGSGSGPAVNSNIGCAGTQGLQAANGGNTLAVGGACGTSANAVAGSNVIMPKLTNANIIIYFDEGFSNILSGAQGGGTDEGPTAGAVGANGLYLQATNIIAPNVIANGVTTSGYDGYGVVGSGGGGAIIFAYNSVNGGYSAGNYNISGGRAVTSGTDVGRAGGFGQVNTINYITPPIPVSFSWYYPYKFYTQSTNNTVTFTLNQTYNGVTTVLQSGVTNINYTPPATQTSGLYQYGFTETQGSATLAWNITDIRVKMVDVKAFLSTTYPAFQYYPVQLSSNTLLFNVAPLNYSIDKSVNTVSGVNVLVGSSTLSLPINMRLTYPIASFNVSNSVNPAVPLTIPLNAFTFTASNTGAIAPYNRPILNLTTYNQSTLLPIFGTTQLSMTWLINNYTVMNSLTYTSNNMVIYIANTLPNMPNPSITSKLLIAETSNTGYIQTLDNECPTTVTSSPAAFGYYLIATGLGAQYTVDVSSGFSAEANGDYLQVLKGASSAFATEVEQVSISAISFPIPLIVGAVYGFDVVGPNCNFIYATNFSTPTSPIYINLPLNTSTPGIALPNVQATCLRTFNNVTGTSNIVCTANDMTGQVDSWQFKLYNESSFTIPQVASNSQNGNTFFYFNNTLGNLTVYQGILSYTTTNGFTGSKTFTFNLNFAPGLNTATDGFWMAILILVCVGFGVGLSFTPGGAKHAVSNTLFIMAFGFFLGYMIGLSTSWGLLINSALIVFCVFIAVMSMFYENKPDYG